MELIATTCLWRIKVLNELALSFFFFYISCGVISSFFFYYEKKDGSPVKVWEHLVFVFFWPLFVFFWRE